VSSLSWRGRKLPIWPGRSPTVRPVPARGRLAILAVSGEIRDERNDDPVRADADAARGSHAAAALRAGGQGGRAERLADLAGAGAPQRRERLSRRPAARAEWR